MEEKPHILEPLLERVEELGKTSYQLFRLKTIDKTTNVLSEFFSRGLAIVIFCLALVVTNIGAAYWLGDILGKVYYGFFCVAGFYIILGIILYFFAHESVKKTINDSIISKVLD